MNDGQFDIVLCFTDTPDSAQIFVDTNVKDILSGLLKEHKQVIIRTNWFSKDVQILIPDRAHIIQDDKEL